MLLSFTRENTYGGETNEVLVNRKDSGSCAAMEMTCDIRSKSVNRAVIQISEGYHLVSYPHSVRVLMLMELITPM